MMIPEFFRELSVGDPSLVLCKSYIAIKDVATTGSECM